MADSVDAYINAQPETILSKDQYWSQNYAGKQDGILKNPKGYNSFEYRVGKFFGARDISKFESEYDAYLNNVNARNEFLASQSARAWDKMMDDTKYQRMMKDFEAAGLNPYLLVNNGSFSASAPTSSKADYKFSQKSEQKRDTGRNLALLFLALAKVASVLL